MHECRLGCYTLRVMFEEPEPEPSAAQSRIQSASLIEENFCRQLQPPLALLPAQCGGIVPFLSSFSRLAGCQGCFCCAMETFMGAGLSSFYTALDNAVSKGVFALLERYDVGPAISPATAKLPLVASPTPVILSCAGYLLVVGLGVLAIRWSKAEAFTQDPLPLRILVILHNCFLFALSALMCGGIVTEAVRNK